MKVLSAGGGSGGHVTPVLAVINELSQFDPNLAVTFICDRKFAPQATDLMSRANVPVRVSTIFAGKVRRYHSVAWWKQLLDIPTTLKNIGDIFLMGLGTLQSIWLVSRLRPDVVFTKGGFVCVPVAIAARLWRIPIVLHDSDAHPGLANRIISRFATSIATGAPLEHYASYPADRSHYVGTPVDRSFVPFTDEQKLAAKTSLGFPDIARPLVVITGGGLGARRINDAAIDGAAILIDAGMSVLLITGQKDFARYETIAPDSVHYKIVPFVSEGMAQVLGAADVVVTRAGATTLLELAALEQAVIIVPNPLLTGGHQLKNAVIYEKEDAAEIFAEEALAQPGRLAEHIVALAFDTERQTMYRKRIALFAKRDAALDVAHLIVEAGKQGSEAHS